MAKINNFEATITALLEEYGDIVYQATEDGLTAAEKILVTNLKADSPEDEGDYAKLWKSTGKKYKLQRYVGNSKTVDGKSGEIPLSNILEYSLKSRHQGRIKRVYEASIDEMASAMVAEIKKEV
ncbi:hypothetical protein [Bacteroides sp.]|uniref:hypothetical protein n=1 Tax=Bacteroides sp. TaxID=29523 RepID=UPI00260B68FB|nr:hypothetical protein [Bacteroides sp.]MDD3040777.1 hypothetical protein [Bacteroides sp.]